MSGPWIQARRTRVAGTGAEPLLFTAAALLVMLGAHAYAAQADMAAQDRDDEAQAKVRHELAPRIAAAYAQGQRDAAAALQGQPQGMAFMQACLALKGVQP